MKPDIIIINSLLKKYYRKHNSTYKKAMKHKNHTGKYKFNRTGVALDLIQKYVSKHTTKHV